MDILISCKIFHSIFIHFINHCIWILFHAIYIQWNSYIYNHLWTRIFFRSHIRAYEKIFSCCGIPKFTKHARQYLSWKTVSWAKRDKRTLFASFFYFVVYGLKILWVNILFNIYLVAWHLVGANLYSPVHVSKFTRLTHGIKVLFHAFVNHHNFSQSFIIKKEKSKIRESKSYFRNVQTKYKSLMIIFIHCIQIVFFQLNSTN